MQKERKPSFESVLSEELQAARAAIKGFPNYFRHANGEMVRIMVRTICGQINNSTTSLVHASNLGGKQVIAARVEKEKGGCFKATDLRFEKDLF